MNIYIAIKKIKLLHVKKNKILLFRIVILIILLLLTNCNISRENTAESSKLVQVLNKQSVVMFIGAHPDDETIIAPFLSYCSDICEVVYVVTATRGEAGWNLNKEYLSRTLAEVREEEFRNAVSIINCQPIVLDYINGRSQSHPKGLALLEKEDAAFKRWKSKGDYSETPEQVLKRWTNQIREPETEFLSLLQEKNPDIVITFDPSGVTGHSEHQAVNIATNKAVKMYNEIGEERIYLFNFFPKNTKEKDLDIIKTTDLNKITSKNYIQIAKKAHSCYETQFGPKGSKRNKRWIKRHKAKVFLKLIK